MQNISAFDLSTLRLCEMGTANYLDELLSDKVNKLGDKIPVLLTASLIASFGADEDIAIPLYLFAGIVGTFFSWSLVATHLTVDESCRNCLRATGNLGLDMVMVWVLTCAIESTLKLLFQRPRPRPRTKAVLPGDIYSFPSGHSMRGAFYYLPYLSRSRFVQAATTAVSSALLTSSSPAVLPLNSSALPLPLCSLAVAGAVLTGFSRVAHLRHWPSDVLMGGVLGYVLGLWFEALPQAARMQAFSAAVLWAVAVAVLQYWSGVRRVFSTSGEWSLFVVVVVLCHWLYLDDSVQLAV